MPLKFKPQSLNRHLAKLISEVFLRPLLLVRKPQTWGCVFADLIDSFELGSHGKFVFLVTMWFQYILWKTENDHLLWAGNIWCTFFFFLTCCYIVFSLPLIIYIEKRLHFDLTSCLLRNLICKYMLGVKDSELKYRVKVMKYWARKKIW